MSRFILRRTDAELLEMLDMRDHGMTCDAIGKHIKASKNAVVGLLYRITKETESSRHDGSMPQCWWRAGLAKRGLGDG